MDIENEKYLKHNDKYQDFLLCTSYFLIIPPLFSLITGQYICALMTFILFVTSILRWGYRQNELYQYIDHSYAKFLPCATTFVAYILSFKYEEYIIILWLFLSVCGIFFAGVIAHEKFMSIKNNVFHMYVHIYAVFSFCLFAGLNYIKHVRLDKLLESSDYSEFLPLCQ